MGLAALRRPSDAEFSQKIAAAMAAGGGAGALGFKGTGTGASGGDGRIHGMGKIDTGDGMKHRAGAVQTAGKRLGKFKVGSGSVQGACQKGHISSVVRRRGGKMRACYEKRLEEKPDLAGKLSAKWTITREGKVSNATTASNDLGDEMMTQCIARELRRMRFLAPEAGTCAVEWPFVFTSSGGE